METLSSRIDAVTVYRSGALVTRSAPLPALADGDTVEVRIDNLPLAMDDASLRFRVEGQGRLPLACDAAVGLDVGRPDEGLLPARDEELESAITERARCAAAVEQISSEMSRIERLGPTPRPEPEEGKQPADSPTRPRIALMDLRSALLGRMVGSLAQAEEALRLASERVAAAEERRRLASTAREAREHELRKTVTVRLEGGDAQASGRLVLQYLVPGAVWAPTYALRLSDGLSAARLEARAQVRQRSGEDWTSVQLTLSTAAAQAWTELPELRSLRIGRRQAAPRRNWRPPPTGAAELYADHDAAFGRPEAPPPRQEARRTRTETATAAAEDLQCGDPIRAERSAGRAPPPASPPPPVSGPQAGGPPPPEAALCFAAPAPAACEAIARAPRSHAAVAKKAALVAGGLLARASRSADFEMESEEASPAEVTGSCLALPEPPDVEIEPDRALMVFGSLRMRSSTDLDRGRLVPETGPENRMVQRAVASANAQGRWPLPSGCVLPDSVGGFDFAIRAGLRADVPADGVFHSVALSTGSGLCEPRYLCVPRESQDVFRRVELDCPLPCPALAGPVDVYVDGAYLATDRIEHTPAGGRIRLGLGVEQAIKVARNVRFEEVRAGLIGGSLDLQHEIRIVLRNHLPDPATVEVLERVPVPADKHEDEIAIAIDQVRPPWEEWEPEERPMKGGKRWTVEVAAGAERELTARWTVRVPKGCELVGGNRREV